MLDPALTPQVGPKPQSITGWSLHEGCQWDIPSSLPDLQSLSWASFLNLPNELILIIVDHLELDKVAALGCTCHCLNELSLWSYTDSTIMRFSHLGSGATFGCVDIHSGHDPEAFEQTLFPSSMEFAPTHLTSLYTATVPRQCTQILDWVLHCFNNSPVHAVMMDGAMESTLSQMNLPHLDSFTLLYAPDEMETTVDMVDFLGCHLSLKTLILGAHTFW
ncbi:hypothetical protein ARMSODRAFT_1020816 [Armillaria solidipes]|uniref:F-box domain-containing protein n=1 Tax=Armillaria solidipes TaxID=1076256 RepID=A0A2H3B8Y6_9AGAR|nr:hypothetical protein ARMSODRAFT_1020816 [Armillaria solidipes]